MDAAVRCFVAYPANPPALAETIRTAMTMQTGMLAAASTFKAGRR